MNARQAVEKLQEIKANLINQVKVNCERHNRTFEDEILRMKKVTCKINHISECTYDSIMNEILEGRKEFKTFKDLQDVDAGPITNYKKKLYFSNGYGINVIKEYNSDGSESGLYECELLKKNPFNITNRVNVAIRNCTEEKVTEIMKQIQEL